MWSQKYDWNIEVFYFSKIRIFAILTKYKLLFWNPKLSFLTKYKLLLWKFNILSPKFQKNDHSIQFEFNDISKNCVIHSQITINNILSFEKLYLTSSMHSQICCLSGYQQLLDEGRCMKYCFEAIWLYLNTYSTKFFPIDLKKLKEIQENADTVI